MDVRNEQREGPGLTVQVCGLGSWHGGKPEWRECGLGVKDSAREEGLEGTPRGPYTVPWLAIMQFTTPQPGLLPLRHPDVQRRSPGSQSCFHRVTVRHALTQTPLSGSTEI